MAAPAPSAAPQRSGNLLTNKLGPLPTWVWLGIATVLIVVVALFMRGKSKSSSQAQPGQTAGQQFVPDIIIQNGQGPGGQPPPVTGTVPPPGSVPPVQPPPTGTGPTAFPFGQSNADIIGQSIANNPNFPRFTGNGTPGPSPVPGTPPPSGPTQATPPKPKAQTYTTVTVAKWTAKNTPWQATLSGIAQHYHTTVAKLAALNGIKDPNLIHPGQKIRVPT